MVTTAVDRELVEKEVWFVATGAEEVGAAGMKAFLAAYGHALEDAMIINLDTVGSGAVAFVTRDGMAKRYEADRRLVGATRRAVREADLPVKGRESRGLSTDATAALARGFRAMSIRAFDINGRLPNWHWSGDTADGVAEANVQLAVDLVTAIIKEL
jgi:putative aminopeptidase FrvX